MEKDYLNKLKKIEQVSVPDSLMEGIQSKIETKRIVDKRNNNLVLAFTFILLFANAGVVISYNKAQSKSTASQQVNPYSFGNTTFIEYD